MRATLIDSDSFRVPLTTRHPCVRGPFTDLDSLKESFTAARQPAPAAMRPNAALGASDAPNATLGASHAPNATLGRYPRPRDPRHQLPKPRTSTTQPQPMRPPPRHHCSPQPMH
ncbi:hypothetical protein DMP23_03795 [Amycolatopsis sp. A1MSW2902]